MTNKKPKILYLPMPRDVVECLLIITDSLDKKYTLTNVDAIIIGRHICFTQMARDFLTTDRVIWYMHKSYMRYVSLLVKSALSTTERFARKDDPTHLAMETLSAFIKALNKKDPNDTKNS